MITGRLLLIAFVALIALLIRWAGPPGGRGPPKPQPCCTVKAPDSVARPH